jgi:8-oxo-dGTP pyrophosphatase MutT (NUDIX family)
MDGEKKKTNLAGLPIKELSSGGVVFKESEVGNENKSFLWLITHSRPSRSYPFSVWRLPKGWVDDSEESGLPGPVASCKKKATEDDLRSAAIREVQEEGGVVAEIIKKIGSVSYSFVSEKRGGKVVKRVVFYLMRWVGDLPDGFGTETSKVLWLPFSQARKKLSYQSEKEILDKAQATIEAMSKEGLV